MSTPCSHMPPRVILVPKKESTGHDGMTRYSYEWPQSLGVDRAIPDSKAKLTHTEALCFGDMSNVSSLTAKRIAQRPESFPKTATPAPLPSLTLHWFSWPPPPSSLLWGFKRAPVPKPMSKQFQGEKSHAGFFKSWIIKSYRDDLLL